MMTCSELFQLLIACLVASCYLVGFFLVVCFLAIGALIMLLSLSSLRLLKRLLTRLGLLKPRTPKTNE